MAKNFREKLAPPRQNRKTACQLSHDSLRNRLHTRNLRQLTEKRTADGVLAVLEEFPQALS
jgi:hypothetical protein